MTFEKIDEQTIKETTTIEKKYDKGALGRRKAVLEEQLLKINNLLKEFDK